MGQISVPSNNVSSVIDPDPQLFSRSGSGIIVPDPEKNDRADK